MTGSRRGRLPLAAVPVADSSKRDLKDRLRGDPALRAFLRA